MIFNRTQEDVDNAKLLRRDKVQKFLTLTTEDIATLEKGTLTINTLNRIEEEQGNLKDIINSMGYWNTQTSNKTWDYTQIFYAEEFQRIIDNTSKLRDAFYVYYGTPATPPVSYKFEDINSLEKILYDLDAMASDIMSYYRECGNIECGGV